MEEDSINSSMQQALTSQGEADPPEESGWTDYFEDFLSNNRDYGACTGLGNSAFISDAASCTAWKFSGSGNDRAAGYSSEVKQEKICKNLSFKKRRTRVLEDDSLEDTASSPVNSPKVSDVKQLAMNTRKRDENINGSQGGSTCRHCSEVVQTDERNELSFIGRENYCTELKKKGLCLVPFSTFVKYLG